MSFDREHGCCAAGTIGSAEHQGTPLTVEEIKALQPGQRIVITWAGGNGPWEGVVALDPYLGACYASAGGIVGPLLTFPEEQTNPLNRITLAGWGQSDDQG